MTESQWDWKSYIFRYFKIFILIFQLQFQSETPYLDDEESPH